jgi:hypothetical protein
MTRARAAVAVSVFDTAPAKSSTGTHVLPSFETYQRRMTFVSEPTVKSN